MAPTLLGNDNQEKHKFLYWDYPEYGGQQAVRMGSWKGIRKDIKKGNLEIELYNLDEDIQELNNVANSYPEIVEKIALIMKSEHSQPEVSTFLMPALGDKGLGNQ